jgi:hypothetical protein
MRTLLAAVANEPNAKLMFEWLLNDELKPDDKLHILHVAMRDQTDAALPASDYFDQVGPTACFALCRYRAAATVASKFSALLTTRQRKAVVTHVDSDCWSAAVWDSKCRGQASLGLLPAGTLCV